MKAILVFLLAALAWLGACAQGVLPVPALTARVIDQTGTLDDIQRKGLEDKLAAFEAKKGSQLVILMVPTTQPEDIASYANRVGNAWKIGRKDVGDGILLIVAKNDRKVRIEVAKTLEGAVPDLAAKQVIDGAITPRFKQGDFAGGLQAAADQLIARVTGEALPAPTQGSANSGGGAGGFDWADFGIFLFVGVPIGATVLRTMFGNKMGSVFTGGAFGAIASWITSSLLIGAVAGMVSMLFALMLGMKAPAYARRRGSGRSSDWSWGSGSSSGGSWSSGGSDSFSSGGGGDFGGGGASGDW
ncbi:YgcG family protein [Caenimonas sedimenti]|uniref:YgcG family protein n=1 Tax=Caenimonas sedimenti TaxID=2596921 RepID=A0A562ZMH0_9BURK|nr:TPM domain-containing protein [Caenimonas sedimenti]TWO69782.1 YgcG family protein [Caenimonas sedimenti]